MKNISSPPRQQGVALVVVLSLIAIITILALTFFISVSTESQATQSQSSATSSFQLATSASQIAMSQIAAASSGTNRAWTSQPGLLRTFDASGPSTVYKLYSATNMVTDTYSESEDEPPPDWKSSPALFCDVNAPVFRAQGGGLAYPIADPSVAGIVPGFSVASSAPGYSGTAPSPTNNPLPMPVLWLYVLKNGEVAAPASVAGDGSVSFATTGPVPTSDNPVVGRVAFWADDESSKVNVNTAGYALNDTSFSTYWDTPVEDTVFETEWLSQAQPWTNEFQRYPGHPATTDLSVIFQGLSSPPTRQQIFDLTPRYRDGGTEGGNVRVIANPTRTQTNDLLKNERLFASIDEAFYTPGRGANSAGISQTDLEARRFFLTATSRAPEVTLWGTPRVTIWPMFRDATKRTPLDQLIAFASTIGNPATPPFEPFFFVRDNPMSSRELLDIPDNRTLWGYLQELSRKPVPVFNRSFEAKYGTDDRDQILTSIFDAIRLANLDDRTGPAPGTTSGWSFTAGELRRNSSGDWASFPGSRTWTAGYIAPTDGPNNTRGPGRASALVEVTFLFARPNDNVALASDGVRFVDKVNVAVMYGFLTPSAGFVQPGVNRRIRVSGLGSFRVRSSPTEPWQEIFPASILPGGVYDQTTVDSTNVSRREVGGRIEYTSSQQRNPPGTSLTTNLDIAFGPPTGTVNLPIDTASPNSNPFEFSGGTMTIQVFSPSTASAPYQEYEITFPPAQALTPLLTPGINARWIPATNRPAPLTGEEPGRWQNLSEAGNPGVWWESRLSQLGDTLIGMQSPTGDFRSEILRSSINDFRPHSRYGRTDILSDPGPSTNYATRMQGMSRRASNMRFSENTGGLAGWGAHSSLYARVYGQLSSGFNNYTQAHLPPTISHTYPQAVTEAFPPGDFSTGPGNAPNGSLSPKSDEGAQIKGASSPYFIGAADSSRSIAGPTLASPNREIPSAIYFGSIPTGQPWRTLLFRPARAYHPGGTGHFGATSPPDHFLLDWFHMPVVEPYAISDRFSTAGKINLNAQIKPFGSYVTRESALHALLRSTRLPAIPNPVVEVFNGSTLQTRHPIDVEQTLDLLRRRSTGADASGLNAYLSHGEICSVDLVPQGSTSSNLSPFWSDKTITGDNLREAAYTSLLPRLTTRSNTFTVHVVAQSLKPGPGRFGWNESTGQVASEWRGEFTVERYIDPEDPDLSTINFRSGTESVEPFYRFRTLGMRRFNP